MHTNGRLALALLLPAACASAPAAQPAPAEAQSVELRAGAPLVVRADPGRTVRVRSGAPVLAPLGSEGFAGVIQVLGQRGVTLDLADLVLRGTPAGTDLDRNAGWGVVLKDCQDVTIRGGGLGGYKVCVAAFGCERLTLEGLRFDGWYGARLLSTTAAEDGSDWLWPHKNDEREWMTNYGAAIALEGCRDATIRACRGRHGQNGILLTRCEGTRIYDCDFSFLSGWGLAMYRTNRALVARNRFDYCVRGYSHGVYWRGQDSAGILMFERCSDNVFAENSATHGGDGVFLFAGRDTVEGLAFEKGELDAGGSDRNVWWRNDFSYAVANAIEATFSSDNWAIGNLLDGSHQHGVWGGYSRRMVVLGNSIRGTRGGGVSIEHGQECAVVGNTIEDSDLGVELWWDEDPDLVGGPYGKHRDTASRDHLVAGNRCAGNGQDLVLRKTTGVLFGDNTFAKTDRPLEVVRSVVVQQKGETPLEVPRVFAAWGSTPSGTIADSSLKSAFGSQEPEWLVRARAWAPPELPGKQKTFARDRGVKQGLDTIVLGEWGPWDFEGGEPRPRQREPGGLLVGATWDAAWFRWEPRRGDAAGSGSDPRDDVARWRKLAATPLDRGAVGVWLNPWGGDEARRRKVGNDHFGLIAKASVEIVQAGRYRLTVVSDDGVRVLVDGKAALENWTWHAPTRDTAEVELARGKHELVLEYFQIDGATALTIELAGIEAK
jgi:hypothetical protein